MAIFLSSCIDFSLIHDKRKLSDVLIPNCYYQLGVFKTIFVLVFISWAGLQITKLGFDVPEILEIKSFYETVFNVTDVFVLKLV